jgi:hypothetical protein
MLFQAVMKFLSRLVEFKILVNWGLAIAIGKHKRLNVVVRLNKSRTNEHLFFKVSKWSEMEFRFPRGFHHF